MKEKLLSPPDSGRKKRFSLNIVEKIYLPAMLVLLLMIVPKSSAQSYTGSSYRTYHEGGRYNDNYITGMNVTAGIQNVKIAFIDVNTNTVDLPATIDRSSIGKQLLIKFQPYVRKIMSGWNLQFDFPSSSKDQGEWDQPGTGSDPADVTASVAAYINSVFSGAPGEMSDETVDYSNKAATVYLYAVDANGNEILINSYQSIVSGRTIPITDDYAKIMKYGKLKIRIALTDSFTSNETVFPVDLVDPTSVRTEESLTSVEWSYAPNWSNPSVSNETSQYLTLSGEPDTKIVGAQESGGSTSNHALDISQSGSGKINLTTCNLTSLLFSLQNVDFSCQNITSIQLKDVAGNVKRTFNSAEYSTVGTNQINLSFSNIVGIAENDKLCIALTNSCTTNHESDYTIVLSNDGYKPEDGTRANKDLYPDGQNKRTLDITQKAGTTWCNGSSQYSFTVTDAHGYSYITPTYATTQSGSYYTTPAGNAISLQATYDKCTTELSYSLPATHNPKTPAISDLQYCNGNTVTLPVTNKGDYTATDQYRLLLNGSVSVPYSTTSDFAGINLNAVGSATAVVEVTNGECTTASSPVTIYSRQQPTAPAISGRNYYYAETVNTTITHTNLEDGINYTLYKDGNSVDTWSGAGTHAMTLTKGDYKITARNSNSSCAAETSFAVTLNDLNIGSGWTSSSLNFCQLNGTKDLNSFVSFNDPSSVTFSSTTGLVITDGKVDLGNSNPGTYTITCTAVKDGVTKVFTKDFTVRPKATTPVISLINSTDFSCNQNAAQIQAAPTAGYEYTWMTQSEQLTEKTNTLTYSFTKADGQKQVTCYATAPNGCMSAVSNTLTIQKFYLTADIAFVSSNVQLCKAVGSSLDMDLLLSGNDKTAVLKKQSGYNYSFTSNAAGLVIGDNKIDQEQSTPGSYTLYFNYSQNGCSKTIAMQVIIKPMPSTATIELLNSSTITCDLNDVAASVKADYPSYTYSWFKNGIKVDGQSGQSATIAVPKADGTAKIYAIPELSGCSGLKSNEVTITKKFVDADIKFATADVSENCQTVGGTLDVRSLLAGSDKTMVVDEQNGYTWDMSYPTSGMLFTDEKKSIINLEKSFATTYTALLNIHKDGCNKTISKDIKIKPRPIDATIELINADGISCNQDDAKFKANIPQYSYSWYKNSTKLTETSNSLSVPISKADGATTIYAVPVLDGCAGVKSNEVSITKKFVDTDLAFKGTSTSYCQKTGGTVDISSLIEGSDLLNILQKQSGWGYSLIPENGLYINGTSLSLESEAGSHVLKMNISKDGCSKTIQSNIVMRPKPNDVTISLIKDETCSKNSYKFKAISNVKYDYLWYSNMTQLSYTGDSAYVSMSKADGLQQINAVPYLGGCAGVKTNIIKVQKKYVDASFGFNSSDIILPSNKTINVFDYTTGTDKQTIMDKASGFSYSFAFNPVKQTSIATTTGKVDAGTGIQAGDTKYLLNLTVSKDGCDSIYSKTALIKDVPKSGSVTIKFSSDSTTQKCNSNNVFSFVASDSTSNFTYKWYKNDKLVSGSGYRNSIEVFKSDGRVKIYAVPYTNDGWAGDTTNVLYAQKKYITADVQLDSKTSTICSTAGEKIDVYSYLRGSDVENVKNGQYGYSYSTVGDCGLAVTGSRYIDVDNSLAEDVTSRTVSFTINQDGCSLTQTKTFIIKQRPKDITLSLATKSSSNLFCNGDTLNFVASTSDASATTYNWYKNGAKFATTSGKNLSYPFKDSGAIGVYVQSAYNNGCVSTPSDTIMISQKNVDFNIALDPTSVAYCPGATKINLFDFISGSDKQDVIAGNNNCSYNFSATGNNGLALVSNSYLDLDNSKSAAYTLTFDVVKNGCSRTFTKPITIKSRPAAPVITYTNNTDKYYCVGDAVSFKDTGSQTGIGYMWDVNGTANAGGSTFTTTGSGQSMSVSARAYYTANNCQSAASNSVTITNVLPAVTMYLLQNTVTVNDSAKLYVSEPVASKSISLVATRVSDSHTTNIAYKRSGNVITLIGTLTPGVYRFTGIAENSKSGYCSQNIVIDSTLTVTGGSTATSVNSNKIQALDSTISKVYADYIHQIQTGQLQSLLQPVVTSTSENARVIINSSKASGEFVTIRVYDVAGNQISLQTGFLNPGENTYTIASNQKPGASGVYLIRIEYQSSGKTDTLKGVIR